MGIAAPSLRARVVVADPPWPFKDRLTMAKTKRGAESNYAVMTVDQIAAFEMPYAVADDALLFLWRVSSMQAEALRVMEAWGFDQKSEIVWEKLTAKGKRAFGMGRYVRMAHEVCLIGRRGRAKVRDRSVRSVFSAPVGPHSQKPDAFYDIVERLSEGPYVELFARRRRPGWLSYGLELPAEPACIYCGGAGSYRDDLSGGESYCTCLAGVARKSSDAEAG